MATMVVDREGITVIMVDEDAKAKIKTPLSLKTINNKTALFNASPVFIYL